MEKENIKILITALVAACAGFIFTIIYNGHIIDNYKAEIIVKDSIYNYTIDSLNNVILETENNAKYFEYLLHCNDLVLDSVSEELEVSKVKLERIREYNRIAGQGNNIKFLRGWINRVLNE